MKNVVLSALITLVFTNYPNRAMDAVDVSMWILDDFGRDIHWTDISPVLDYLASNGILKPVAKSCTGMWHYLLT